MLNDIRGVLSGGAVQERISAATERCNNDAPPEDRSTINESSSIEEMGYSNLSFSSVDRNSFLRLFTLSLHNKISAPIPNIRSHTSVTLSEFQLPHKPNTCLRKFRTSNYQSTFIQNSGSHFNSRQLQDALFLFNESFPANSPKNSCQSSYLDLFKKMRSKAFPSNQFAYVNVISACTAAQNFNFGNCLLSLVLKVGFLSNGYVLSALVDLFSKGSHFAEALDVFSYSYSDNVVCWNAIIAGAVRNGENLIALKLFCQMVDGFCMPNGFTFSSVLGACAGSRKLDVGRGMHAWVVKFDQQNDIFVGTAAIDLYAKCGDMDAAAKVFLSMPARNVVSWTTLISGYLQEENGAFAYKYFIQMMRNNIDINVYTITSVVSACSKCLTGNTLYQIHGWILKFGLYSDLAVKAALMGAYGRIGSVQMCEKVFEDEGTRMHLSNWSAMISCLVQNQYFSKSVELFLQMLCEDLKPDNSCISSILSTVDCVIFGEQLHSYVVKIGLIDNLLVCSSLFTMYSKCGSIGDSYELFGQMPDRDRVSWTSMITGFARHGNAKEAFQLLREMILKCVEPDDMTLFGVLIACNSRPFIDKGKEIHCYSIHRGYINNSHVGSSIISMYSRCENIDSARNVFSLIECKDQILWSSLICGYFTNNKNDEALVTFFQMATTGMQIDPITSSSVIGACAQLSMPVLGRQLHGQTIKAGLILHNSVASTLVTLYANCGIINDSRKMFNGIQNPDMVTYSAMIEGYAQHGEAKEALETVELMKNAGMKPDSITFLNILYACSHKGLVDEGFFYFKSMKSDYGIEPEMRHYSCMVDLLGRAGRLKETADLIDSMPANSGLLVWSILLGACRVYGDIEIGSLARKRVLELESHNSGALIAASNMSAAMGDWEQVLEIRSSMKGLGMKKEPGWSAL